MNLMKYKLQYKRYSERSILIQWPSIIDENILQDLLLYKKTIEKFYGKAIVEVIFAYNSLLILYLSTIDNVYDEFSSLKSLYSIEIPKNDQKNKLWRIPVCYSTALAPDLEMFSQQKSLSKDEVIALHTAPIYQVYFIGFLPGFLYLGGLDERLRLSRKKSPSLNVEKGSVAIGENQTGIYPVNSPGGWHVIGKSPLAFFNSNMNLPCFASSGDKIKFISIEESKYNDISNSVYLNSYELQYEIL